MSDRVTVEQLEEFAMGQVNARLRNYTRAINRDLAQQNPIELMQRNVLATMQELHDDMLQQLDNTKDDTALQAAKSASDKFLENFLTAVLKHHRSSCALSNFPEEHNPSPEYIAEVLSAAELQWRQFELGV